jgi:hypothetical protein
MAAMETQALDDPTGDIDEATYREQAAASIDQIAQQVKRALADAAIGIDVFLVVPGSGNAILLFGTAADPDDETWQIVSAITSATVRKAVGLHRVRCRPVTRADTNSMHAPASQHTGTEQRDTAT